MTHVETPQGPTWISGVFVLTSPSNASASTMWARFSKVDHDMNTKRWGLLLWDDEAESFTESAEFDVGSIWQNFVGNSAFVWLPADSNVTQGSEEQYVYFGSPFPFVRVPATPEAVVNLAEYESWTPLQEGQTAGNGTDASVLAYEADGVTLSYAWRKNTPPLTNDDRASFEANGIVGRDQFAVRLRDATSADCIPVELSGGSTYWNPYRGKFIAVATAGWGTDNGGSPLGEIWYAESTELTGPWEQAVRVITHNVSQMSLYNPISIHPFDKDNGRTIYITGTYSFSFSAASHPTPLYDYNNLVFELDLSQDLPATIPVAGQQACPQHPGDTGGTPRGWIIAGCTTAIVCVVGVLAVTVSRRRRAKKMSTILTASAADPTGMGLLGPQSGQL